MHRLVSPFILEQFASGQRSGDLTAAGLFVDISGFSKITHTLMSHGQHGAEVMATIMRAVFAPLVEVVYGHEGFITGFAGDGFTALLPIKDEETTVAAAAQRALAAGWTIRQRLVDHPQYETTYGTFNLAVKVGLAVGDCHWQIIRAAEGEKATFYFRGTAVDEAAAAEKVATKNIIVLTPPAADLLTGQVQTVPLGDYLRLISVPDDLPAPRPLALPPYDEQLLSHFFPSAVIGAKQMGEFRQVINLFVSLQGQLNDEQVTQFGQTLLALQAVYGGLLTRIDFGDKGCNTLLFWGAPATYENDLHRAFNFILDLQEQSPISIRAGVTRQIAHAGVIGSDLHGEFTCYGDGVNLAARLMMGAPWGTIWLDEGLARQGGEGFVIEAAGERPFKGFADPQAVYRLVDRKSVTERFFEHELVGRQPELAQLTTFIRPIQAETAAFAGILTLVGEAGLGKSRLAAAWQQQVLQANPEPPQFYVCQTDQLKKEALNPFVYWLNRYFDQRSSQSEASNKRAFNHKLDRLLATVTDSALSKTLTQGRSCLGALVNLHWPNSQYEKLPPEGRHEWTFTTLKALIVAESRRRPLVLLLEDAHWLDPESVAFVERLVRLIEDVPLAIVATARPTIGAKPLFGAVPYEQIDLTHMAAEDLQQVANNVLGAPLDDELAMLLIRRAEGNPFFCEQIALYLRTKGEIGLVDGVWQLTRALPKVSLPADIRTIFTARLDQLTASVKTVVQTAAVLGHEFEVQILAQMLEQSERLTEQLAAAEQQDIWTLLSELRYLFKHALLRDAAYEMQVRSQRRELHRLAAEAMVTLYATTLSPHYETIAYHYEAAHQQGLLEVQAEAMTYLRLAAEQAAAAYENETAVDHYSRLLALLPPEQLEARYDLLLAREALYALTGQQEARQQDIEQLHNLADELKQPERQTAVYLRQAEYADTIADYTQLEKVAQAACQQAQETGRVDLEAEALYYLALFTYRNLGDVGKVKTLRQQALQLAQAVGARRIEALCLMLWADNIEDKIADLQQALRIGREIEAPDIELEALNEIGVWSQYTYDFPRAQKYITLLLDTAQEIGNRKMEWYGLANLGSIVHRQGDIEQARLYYKQALVIAQEANIVREISSTLDYFATMAQRQGQLSQAEAYVQQRIAHAHTSRNIELEIDSYVADGCLNYYVGAYDKALFAAETALALAQKRGKNALWEPLLLLGLVAIGQEQLLLAQEHFEAALEIGRQLDNKWSIAWNSVGLGQTLIRLGLAEQAIDPITKALQISQKWNIHAESAALLAQAQLAQGELELASATLQETLTYLEAGSSFHIVGVWQERTWFGLLSYLICYRVLQAAGDERARDYLQTAYEKIQRYAAALPDELSRRQLVENVPWHREIIAIYEGREMPAESEPAATLPSVSVPPPLPLESAAPQATSMPTDQAPQESLLPPEAAAPEVVEARPVRKKKRKKKKKKGRREKRPVVINIQIENIENIENVVSLETLQQLLAQLQNADDEE